jgi:hypothetical protein
MSDVPTTNSVSLVIRNELKNETRPRRSETARSFSGVNLPNLRALTLSRGQKRATRSRRRLLIEMAS